MATLIVLRHAKSAHGLGMPDIERPLNDRGRRDAASAGKHLRAEGLVPDLVLCSAADRTRQTLDRLGLGAESEIRYEPGIYRNDVDTLFELVRQVSAAEIVLVIGHNPSAHQFVMDLIGADVDAFPTSACAVLTIEEPWADLGSGAGRLTSYWTPRRGS
jgi:phosphohistidine phosphatase